MKKIVTFTVVTIVAVVGFLLWRVWGERYVVTIREDQITEAINKNFPFQKTYFSVIDLTLSDPHLALEEGTDRIQFGCKVETNVHVSSSEGSGHGPLRGTASVAGKLRYDSSEGAFYLDESKVEKFTIGGLPDRFTEKVASALGNAVGTALNRVPVYRLKVTDIKQATARLVLREVVVKDKTVVVTLGVGE